MRIQCPGCKELAEVRRFTTASDPPRIEFLCPVCGEQVSQAAEAGASPLSSGTMSPGDVESGRNPGVGAAAGAGAAAGVHVVAGAHVAAEGSAADALGVPSTSSGHGGSEVKPSRPLAGHQGSDALWNLWDRVTEDFTDEARHDAFIAASEVAGSLPYAAARYREWADSHPEDIIARERLGRIAALAQVKVLLGKDRGDRDKDPLRQALALGLVMLLIIAVVVITAPLVFRGVTGGSGEGPAPRGRPGAAGVPEPRLQNLRRPAPSPGKPAGLTPPGAQSPRSGAGHRGTDAGALPTHGR